MTTPIIDCLSNGLTVSVVEMPASHKVLVSLMVRVGSRFESIANNGASHFLEHMLFQGNATHPTARETSLAFEQAGGPPNALTGVESTEIYFLTHPHHVGEALEALAAMVFSPTFSGLEKERAIIHDEILYDYNESGELIHLGTLTGELLWPDHPLGLGVTGIPSALETLNLELLQTHHARHYTPENMVLALAGNIKPAAAMRLAEAALGKAARGGVHPRPVLLEGSHGEPGPRLKLVTDSDNQFHLQLSFPTPGYNSEEEMALMLLSRLLDDGPTSRLQEELREERGLVYQISGEYAGYQDVGQFDISSSVKADLLPPFLEALVGCLNKIRQEPPSADEMRRAKQRNRFDLEFSNDSLSAQVDRYGWSLLYSTIRGQEEELERTEAITAEDIQSLAQKIFQREAASLVLVGPVKEETELLVRKALAGL